MLRRTAAIVALALLPAMSIDAIAGDDAPIAAGQAILQANCAKCHAITEAGASPLATAPPFRDLHRRYAVEQLAEALAEGITTGHAAMPEFVFKPPEIDAIIAYMKQFERSR